MGVIFPFDEAVALGSIGILLLIGIALRARVKFFQRFFVPACIIGGLLGLILREVHILPLSVPILENITYHIFNLTFISLGLTKGAKKNTYDMRKGFRDIVVMGILIVSVAALQFIIGGGLTYLFNIIGYRLNPSFGFLVTMGFEEGPGQALSIGKSWEGFGFVNASTIGLSFAAIGFLFAIFIGVPLVSWAIRKGYTSSSSEKVSIAFEKGLYPEEMQRESAGVLTTHSSAIDSLSFHLSLVGLVYVLTYFFVKGLAYIAPSDLAEMYWGFFFIWGLLIAYIVRWIIEKIGVGYVLNIEMQERITGFGIDFLVVAAITAISLTVVWEYMVPIIVISAVTGVLTLLWIFYFGSKLWREYTFERISGLYGMETGTLATGLILVRVADPRFKTPAAVDLALSGIIALLPMFIMLHVMNGPLVFKWSLGFTLVIFLIFLLATLVIFRLLGWKIRSC